jgi:hypothetical protein
MPMKKIIAICLTLVYLSFLVGALTPSGINLISYERSLEGNCNEKNESENLKGVEVFHILQVAKNTSRVKGQTIRQNVAKDQASTTSSFDPHKQYISRSNFPVINDPIFLKIRVFRL